MNPVAWWSAQTPATRILIAVGVPLVAVAAIVSGRRQKAADTATENAAPQLVMTGTPSYSSGGGEVFELRRAMVEWMEALNPPPPAGAPGQQTNYASLSPSELISECLDSDGLNRDVIVAMANRGISVNEPRIYKTPCGGEYVLELMRRGMPVPG